MRHKSVLHVLPLLAALVNSSVADAQDSPGQDVLSVPHHSHFGQSPFDPPKNNDQTFFADIGPGLDTGCTFRNDGPLIITVPVDRVVGDVVKLKAHDLISSTARLEMPAFDVDSSADIPPPFNPERDRVSFNGHVVSSEFLSGLDNTWIMNRFDVPIEWVNFPSDPGHGQSVIAMDNTIRIDIDTANPSEEVWCTSIDWASLSIEVVRPVVLAHGILSSGATWSGLWVPNLNMVGIPNSNLLNMGSLDGIANNAAKIATEVATSRSRWGVDAVTLVAHSKGGIDSREFVENSDSVKDLVQIGTPNAGSPLADLVQGILVSSLGLVPSAIVNTLAGPAGVQLTQPFMNTYNHTHGSNSRVTYTSLAGLYHPRVLLDPIYTFLDSIVGPGDTIVPVASVFALGYANHLTFESSGADTQAVHTSQTGSQGIYNILAGTAQGVGTPIDPPPPLRTSSVVKNIQQGEAQSTTIPVDDTPAATFLLMYPSGDLGFSLLSPLGELFNPATIVGNPDVIHQEQDILGGRMEMYRIMNPVPGDWTLEVVGTDVTESSGSVAYAVNAWLENTPITFVGDLAQPNIHVGETLQLLGTLRNGGAALTGAIVTARILLPDGSPVDVSLHDDGLSGDATVNDGIYTANVEATAQSGHYRIVFQARDDASGGMPTFSREDFRLATVSSSSSSFAGLFQDFGVDTDGDGFFNELVIEVGLVVTNAANYRVVGTLTDSNGNGLDATFTMVLPSGSQSIQLRFDGASIFQRGVNGPYLLSRLVLAEEDNLAVMPVDEETAIFRTAAYNSTDFQHTSLTLLGNGSATGVDTNGNGLFDALLVEVDVSVTMGGFYSWSGRLTDQTGVEIALAGNSGVLNAGTARIELSFLGLSVGQHGVNGPYLVRDLLLFGNGVSLSVPHVFSTSAFLASQFEGGSTGNQNTAPVADAGLDQIIECTGPAGTDVMLDGTASFDVDGDPVNHTWTGSFGTVTGATPLVSLGIGMHILTLTIDDGRGGTSSDTVVITVQDTTPPVLSNIPGSIVMNQTILAGATIDLPLPTATDTCGPAFVTSDAPSVFPIGITVVTFTATDAAGNTSTATTTVTVQPVITPGKMLGAGNLVEPNGRRHKFMFDVEERSTGQDRGGLLYSVQANSASRFDDRFVSTAITAVLFSYDPDNPKHHSVEFVGTGTWNRVSGYTFEARAVEAGQPGQGRDRFALTIRDPSGLIVASINGALVGGNIQAHTVKR